MADALGSVGQSPRNRKRVPEYVDFDGLSVHLEVFVTTSSFAVFPHAFRHPQADVPRTKYKASSWNRAPIGDMPALLTRSLWVPLRFSRVWGAVITHCILHTLWRVKCLNRGTPRACVARKLLIRNEFPLANHPLCFRTGRFCFTWWSPKTLAGFAVVGCVRRPRPWLTERGRSRRRLVRLSNYRRAMKMHRNSTRAPRSCILLRHPPGVTVPGTSPGTPPSASSSSPRILVLPPCRVSVTPVAAPRRDRMTTWRPLHLNARARIRTLQRGQGMLSSGASKDGSTGFRYFHFAGRSGIAGCFGRSFGSMALI